MNRKQLGKVVLAGFLLALAVTWLRMQRQEARAQVAEPAPEASAPWIDQLIIQYAPAAALQSQEEAAAESQMARLTAVAGVPLTYFREMSGEAHVLKLSQRLPAAEALAVAARLASLPEVAYAEPDWVLEADWVPNDPRWSDQWHFHAANGINLDDALDVTQGNRGMVIAVLDSGVLLNHPDLVGRTVAGYDMISDPQRANDGDGRDNNPNDPGDWVTTADVNNANSPCFMRPVNEVVRDSSWHGTHVAGTIAASTNNNVGVAGISQAQILPVRVLGKCGSNNSDVVDGIRWAAGLAVAGVPANPFPARIINMSLGATGACPTATQQAIDAARSAGAIVVVSAGNDLVDASTQHPANCNGVITVAATDQAGDLSLWGDDAGSNFGSVVEISAPGTAVLSTMNAGATTPGEHTYDWKGGTSMATPHVAGVIALTLAVRPTLNTEQLLDLLQYTAQGFPAESSCNTSLCGAGIVNANDAVRDIFLIKGSTNGLGLPSQPYGSLQEAYGAAWNGARLNIRADSFGGSYTFNKQITITAVGGAVIIGKP